MEFNDNDNNDDIHDAAKNKINKVKSVHRFWPNVMVPDRFRLINFSISVIPTATQSQPTSLEMMIRFFFSFFQINTLTNTSYDITILAD